MSDPQRCEGGPAALAKVAAWMRLCVCAHPQVEHDIVDRGKRKGQRSECLTTERSGKCGCTLYEDAGSTPSSDEGSGVQVPPIGGVARGVTRSADHRQRPGASPMEAL